MDKIELYGKFAEGIYTNISDVIYDAEENKRYVRLGGQTLNLEGSDIELGVYFDESTNELLVAFQGTASVTDALNNLVSGLSGFDSQFDNIMNFVNNAIDNSPYSNRNYSVTATGHSLGGALAEFFAMGYSNKEVNLVTFNALGTKTIMGIPNKNINFDRYNESNIVSGTHISLDNDIVSLLSDHSGSNNNYIFYDSNGLGVLDSHFMSNLNSAILNNDITSRKHNYFNLSEELQDTTIALSEVFNSLSTDMNSFATGNFSIRSIMVLLTEIFQTAGWDSHWGTFKDMIGFIAKVEMSSSENNDTFINILNNSTNFQDFVVNSLEEFGESLINWAEDEFSESNPKIYSTLDYALNQFKDTSVNEVFKIGTTEIVPI